MEAVGFILIGGLVLSVWIATKIGVDHSREVCEEANLKGSLGERIKRGKEEWEAMSEEEREAIVEKEFLEDVMYEDKGLLTSPDYNLVPGNIFNIED